MPDAANGIVLPFILIIALVGALLYISSPVPNPFIDPTETSVDHRLEPIGPKYNAEIWPYTSKSKSVGGRTLAINLLVHGNATEVRRYMVRRIDTNWDHLNNSKDNGTVVPIDIDQMDWRHADGATRYTYIDAVGEGKWVSSTYQLRVGDYLGTRYHVRAYASPRGEWTAMQAHEEYWDWFRLRHTVVSIADAKNFVESDFMGKPFVRSVSRVHLNNGDTSDGDGWVTLIELLTGVFMLGIFVSGSTRGLNLVEKVRSSVSQEEATLFMSMVSLYLFVRMGGVSLERAFSGVSPKVFGALLYPLIALGLPLVAYSLSKDIDENRAFLLAPTGLGTAFVLDYAYITLSVIPISIVLHRALVLLSMGLVAVGGSKSVAEGRWNSTLKMGLIGWVVALLLPLLGIV